MININKKNINVFICIRIIMFIAAVLRGTIKRIGKMLEKYYIIAVKCIASELKT